MSLRAENEAHRYPFALERFQGILALNLGDFEMGNSVTREEVIDEVRLVPEDKIGELLDVVHEFRVGCGFKNSRSILRFAGRWKSWSDTEFQDFLDETGDRRSRAFSSRR